MSNPLSKLGGSHGCIGEVKLGRSLTLTGGIALVVGGVIGMGIYSLIAGMGAQAGSSVWLALSIAVIIAVVGVIPIVQLSSALPRAGGGYLFTSRLLSPQIGAITSYWAFLGGACNAAFVSLGISGYISQYLLWDIPIQLLAVGLVIFILFLFLFGLKLLATLQIVMVVQLVLALLIYAIGGTKTLGLKFSLDMPQGFGGFAMAIVLAYSASIGFQVIAEMGEEMVAARRNIPLSIAFGAVIILLLYLLVGNTFINSVPYNFDAIDGMTAPLAETGSLFLSPLWLGFLSLGALNAGLTSLNAAAIAIPRELLAQSRDGIIPAIIGRIDKRTRTPLNSIVIFFVFVIVLILVESSIDFYGYMAAVGILMLTAMIGVASIKLPQKYPDHYKNAYFRVPRWGLITIAIFSVISSLGFVFVVFMEMPKVGLIYLVWTAVVAGYILLRLRWMKKSGVDLKNRMAIIPGFDEEES